MSDEASNFLKTIMNGSKPYLSIDIETTGVDPSYCQVIEIGVVADDWVTPIHQLPRFHAYITHDKYVGEPYALSMHATIFRRIAQKNKEENKEFTFLKATELGHTLAQWIKRRHKAPDNPLLAAGKNFSGFDRPFLNALPRFENHVYFHHRVIDPGMLFWNPETDKEPPSSKECMERAGQAGEVAHTALEDALMVVGQVREARERLKLFHQWLPFINQVKVSGDPFIQHMAAWKPLDFPPQIVTSDTANTKPLIYDPTQPMIDNRPYVLPATTVPQRVLTANPRSKFIPYPDDWEPRHNGFTNEPCDMLIGFCACGAGHFLTEDWVVAKLNQYNTRIEGL